MPPRRVNDVNWPAARANLFHLEPEIDKVGESVAKCCSIRKRRSEVRSATEEVRVGGNAFNAVWTRAAIPLTCPCRSAPEFGVARVINRSTRRLDTALNPKFLISSISPGA